MRIIVSSMILSSMILSSPLRAADPEPTPTAARLDVVKLAELIAASMVDPADPAIDWDADAVAIDPAALDPAPAPAAQEPPVAPYPAAGIFGLAFNLGRLDDIWSGATQRPWARSKALAETVLKTVTYAATGYGLYYLIDEVSDSGSSSSPAAAGAATAADSGATATSYSFAGDVNAPVVINNYSTVTPGE
jgi:hypothetical protein